MCEVEVIAFTSRAIRDAGEVQAITPGNADTHRNARYVMVQAIKPGNADTHSARLSHHHALPPRVTLHSITHRARPCTSSRTTIARLFAHHQTSRAETVVHGPRIRIAHTITHYRRALLCTSSRTTLHIITYYRCA